MSKLRVGRTCRQMEHACVDCGKVRWTQVVNPQNGGSPRYTRCHPCAIKFAYSSGRVPRPKGSLSHMWRGGVRIARGYRIIWLPEDDPLRPMANSVAYVGEHRLVMAKHLGRLLKWEDIVHHYNGNRLDNRIENLVLLNRGKHHAYLHTQALKRRILELEERIRELEKYGERRL